MWCIFDVVVVVIFFNVGPVDELGKLQPPWKVSEHICAKDILTLT